MHPSEQETSRLVLRRSAEKPFDDSSVVRRQDDLADGKIRTEPLRVKVRER